jgi:hypothetical protein
MDQRGRTLQQSLRSSSLSPLPMRNNLSASSNDATNDSVPTTPTRAKPSGNARTLTRFTSLGDMPREHGAPSADGLVPHFLFRTVYLGSLPVPPETTQNRELRDQAICRVKAISTAASHRSGSASADTTSPPCAVVVVSTRSCIELWNENQSYMLNSMRKTHIPTCGRGITHTYCFAIIELDDSNGLILHAFESDDASQVSYIAFSCVDRLIKVIYPKCACVSYYTFP